MSNNPRNMAQFLNAYKGAISVNVELSENGSEAHVTIRQELTLVRPGTLIDLSSILRDAVCADCQLFVHVTQVVHSTSKDEGQFVGLWINPTVKHEIVGLTYERQVVLRNGQTWVDAMIGNTHFSGNREQLAGNRQFDIRGAVEVAVAVRGCPFKIPYQARC